jgi:hypothetical protein
LELEKLAHARLRDGYDGRFAVCRFLQGIAERETVEEHEQTHLNTWTDALEHDPKKADVV